MKTFLLTGDILVCLKISLHCDVPIHNDFSKIHIIAALAVRKLKQPKVSYVGMRH